MSASLPGAPWTAVARGRVLHAEGETLFAAQGARVRATRDAGRTWTAVAELDASLWERAALAFDLPARLLRAGFHALQPLDNGDLLGVVRGALVLAPAGSGRFEVVHRVERGSRPLSLCRDAGGRTYYGEYFSNPERREVRVFASDDGRDWGVVHTFAPGAVRHVHGVVRDDARGGLWVLTGDRDTESALWFTADRFATLERVAGGSQRCRAVTAIPLGSGLVVPMDSPAEPNRVQHFDPETGRFETLAVVPGSVFQSTRAAGHHLLSTVVEPSAVNTCQASALFASTDGLAWREIARFERDLEWLRDRRGLLRYPTLSLPTGSSSASALLASGQALAGLHERVVRIEAATIAGAFEAAA